MPKQRVPAEIRDQIISRIRNDGISAAQAAKEHGIALPTVYSWLSRDAEIPINILQINKLKRENEELKRLLGEAMLTNERSKKNPARYGN